MRSFIICTLHPLNIVKVTKSKRMGGARHVACIGEIRNVYKIKENLQRRDHMSDLGTERMIILLQNATLPSLDYLAHLPR
jgi:hypothetical protein